MKACVEAGIEEENARKVIEDEEMGRDVAVEYEKIGRIEEGIDAVPHIRIEGKKRDFTFQGAKEVEEYLKALMQVVKECE